jgi:hypothetical protein
MSKETIVITLLAFSLIFDSDQISLLEREHFGSDATKSSLLRWLAPQLSVIAPTDGSMGFYAEPPR